MEACKYYIEKTNKRISFEYALAKDNNDNLEDAKELVKLLNGMLAHVNLIPINKIENGKFVKSTDNNIIRFRDYLNAHGIVGDKMKCFAKTDLGKARELNEDSYYIPTEENELRIYMLADGMGGYNGGEIASKLAIDSARKYLTNNFNTIPHDRINIEELVRSSMEYANMVVFEKSKEDPELEGMGTTLELVLGYGNKIYIGHGYVQKLVEDGKITREEANTHPKKNMLMKALGCTPYVEPDVTTKGFLKGDKIVLTSDGLTNMVSNQEIYDIVTNDVENATTKLVELANNRGGYDNITVVIVYND